jgi:hypothetical protein
MKFIELTLPALSTETESIPARRLTVNSSYIIAYRDDQDSSTIWVHDLDESGTVSFKVTESYNQITNQLR